MTRKKLILVIAASVAFVIFVIATVIYLNPSPEPVTLSETEDRATDQQVEAPETPEESEQAHSEAEDSDAHGSLLPQATTDAIFLNAQQAAEAYVSQPMDESAATRQTRLRQYFAPNSPVITAKPPVVSDSFNTSKVTTLETDWYDLGGNKMGVIVYMNVGLNTGFNEYEEKQSWAVELIQYRDSWLANKIMKSDVPYIEGVN